MGAQFRPPAAAGCLPEFEFAFWVSTHILFGIHFDLYSAIAFDVGATDFTRLFSLFFVTATCAAILLQGPHPHTQRVRRVRDFWQLSKNENEFEFDSPTDFNL